MTTKVARKIRDINTMRGFAALFQCNPPHRTYDGDTHEFVISSAVTAFDHGGSETFLFPADAAGNVVSWDEMPGSQRSTMCLTDPLTDEGYTIE